MGFGCLMGMCLMGGVFGLFGACVYCIFVMWVVGVVGGLYYIIGGFGCVLGSVYLFGCLVFMLFIVFVGCAYGFSVWLY